MKLITLLFIKFENYKKKSILKYNLSRFESIGKNFIYNGGTFTYENIYIGNNVFIGEQALFLSSKAKIIIGSNVMFGPRVMIVTGDHRFDMIGEYMSNVKEKKEVNDQDVVIEDDVWIGMNSLILKGVRIGTGSIVGAGSIVTRNIPPYTIHIGCKSLNEYERFTKEEILIHEKILTEKYG